MEALALMLIHLLTPGGLSWTRSGVPKTDDAHGILKREKENATPKDLCHGLPSEFEEFLRYCRRLKFAERPDYDRWYAAFQDLAVEEGFSMNPTFIWPPPLSAVSRAVQYHRDVLNSSFLSQRYVQTTTRPKQVTDSDVDRIMGDLAKLNLGERPILGNRDNNVVQPDKPKNFHAASQDDVAVLSSGSENEGQKKAVVRLTKASQLVHLTRLVRETTDNVALSRVVREFKEVLDSSRSRTLTKEGFAFLDALYKQLADPSVYVVPMRTSRKQYDQENLDDGNARRARMTKLLALRHEVIQAKSNKKLAQLVSEFGICIDKSKNRTVTKDSIAFLDGLSSTLRALS